MFSEPVALESFKNRFTWSDIDLQMLKTHLRLCVEEEIGSIKKGLNLGDITTESCKISGTGRAQIIVKEKLIICGLPIIPIILDEFNANSVEIEWHVKEGDNLEAGTIVATLSGQQKEILLTERTVLNFIQKLSGIATLSNVYVKKIIPYGVDLLDTRKTTPSFRQLEKYATACGGSYNHRLGLFDRILIKDNHLAALKIKCYNKLTEMLADIKKKFHNYIVEVEVDSIELVEPVIKSNVDAILLDNFSTEEVKNAVSINKNRVVIEASGGINLNSITEYAKSKPHFISTGSPVYTSHWLDIGLDWQ